MEILVGNVNSPVNNSFTLEYDENGQYQRALNKDAIPTLNLNAEGQKILTELQSNVVEEVDAILKRVSSSVTPAELQIQKSKKNQPHQKITYVKNQNKSCSVANCPSPNNVTYHNFPRSGNSTKNTIKITIEEQKELWAKWIEACNKKTPVNPLTSMICSNHFDKDAYERDLRNELLGLPLRKILKATALPTLQLGKVF